MSNSPEKTDSPEIESKSGEAAAERLEELSKSPEKSAEQLQDAEASTEKARFDALESAIGVESGSKEKKNDSPDPKPRRRGTISKAEKEASFKRQMKDIQASQTPVDRAFSKVIHNKVVEKTSDVLGATVARPNALLAGSVAAFILTLIVYLVAKNMGYQLSGSETIVSFILGWAIGLTYDYLRVVITGKK